jgi:RNA polymerase sigma factor (sigma-70 family)
MSASLSYYPPVAATNIADELEQLHSASFGWAMSCCAQNAADAEDVLQTVYLKVLQGKARFDGRASFKTWLFGVIRKTAAEQRRRSFFHSLKLRHYETTGDFSPHDAESGHALDRSQAAAQLDAALARLPARQREVLHLVFYQDLTIEQAAGVLGVSLGSARTHYERGKQRLRQLIHEH